MANDGILFIGFNQDSGLRLFVENNFQKYYSALKECFMCGLEDGYRIYNTDPLKENAREGKLLSSIDLNACLSYLI